MSGVPLLYLLGFHYPQAGSRNLTETVYQGTNLTLTFKTLSTWVARNQKGRVHYFSFKSAFFILGIKSMISCKVLAPTDTLNQFTSSPVPKAENGTNATFASLIR